MRLNRSGSWASIFSAAVLVAGISVDAGAQSPKRVLYVTHVGPLAHAHPSRLYARDVLQQLGQSSGAFTVTWTDDSSQISAASLAAYDAVVFFTAGELAWTADQKSALLEFVRAGKGFVGVHSATDTFYSWPEYGDLVGGYFETHPWAQPAGILVEDLSHVATAHLGAGFTIDDEIYQFRNWSRAAVHVLLRLDLTSVPPQTPPPPPRPDGDYALAWTKPYGNGRVFYTALGHADAVWDDARFRQHILGGIRWALGDGDGDGLDDRWELRFGLSESSAAGADGAAGDPDNDGATNAQEQLGATHPRGVAFRYLAEGATSEFFDTRVSVLNPDAARPAYVQLRFLKESGGVVTTDMRLPPLAQHGVRVADLPGMAGDSFATQVVSDVPIVSERTMTWGGAVKYGSHAETAVPEFGRDWFFAEGATHSRFDLFFLIQNPAAVVAEVQATFLRSGSPAIVRPYSVGPNRRLTINVDAIEGLEAADVAAAFTSLNGTPFIVERAMYLSRPGELWSGGHASAGVTSLALRWFLAEGATGLFFDTFVLVGNPGMVDAPLRVTYLTPGSAPIVRFHTVGAERRLTLFPEAEPELAATSLSVVVESINAVPIVVERAMWWPGPTGATWQEGHSTLATTQTGTAWALADGEAGGPTAARTYVLVATGDSATNDSLRLRIVLDDGRVLLKTYDDALTPGARFTFDIETEFPEVAGHRFGVIVESLGQVQVGGVPTAVSPMPLIVERAVYADAGGSFWAAGTNLVATRLR